MQLPSVVFFISLCGFELLSIVISLFLTNSLAIRLQTSSPVSQSAGLWLSYLPGSESSDCQGHRGTEEKVMVTGQVKRP